MLKQACAGHVGKELEITAPRIGCEGKKYHPASGIIHKRFHTVEAHIRSYGESIHPHVLKECAGIERGCVAYVATFRIRDYELVRIVVTDILDCAVERAPSFHAKALIESGVRLIRHTVWRSRINDSLIESEDRVFNISQMLWNLLNVSVKPYTQERAFATDIFKKFGTVHNKYVIIF